MRYLFIYVKVKCSGATVLGRALYKNKQKRNAVLYMYTMVINVTPGVEISKCVQTELNLLVILSRLRSEKRHLSFWGKLILLSGA